MLGRFNPILGKIWTNPAIGLKMSFKNVTQWLGLSIHSKNAGLFLPNFGSNMDKHKRWVKNVNKNVTQWLGLPIFDSKLG